MGNTRKVHVALNVNDVNRSVEFYRAMLGRDPVKWKPGYAKFDIDDPALNLTLNEGTVKDQGALNHLGIEVSSTTDVLVAKKRLSDAGLATFDEMNVDCCFALQDKIWVSDPDGYGWEIFTVKVADTRPELSAETRDAGQAEVQRCCR
jgi:catechol 2,3-dioxygenase-like lactoylglutathione lyase family enzyme